MPVTSADVARAAGVSRTTVSYVLNETPGTNISRATAEHVRATAARLGYAPSAAARALRRGRSDLVVCVLPDWPLGPVLDTVLDLLTDALAQRGLFLLVHHHRDTRELRELWRAVSPRVVVCLTDFPAADLRALTQAGVAVVGTGPQTDVDHVGIDPAPQHGVAMMQVDHLVSTGRRHVAVATTPDPRLAEFAGLRTEGAREACLERGLPEPDVRQVDPTTAAVDAVRTWRDAGVDAVACYNDDVALAVLAGARRAGVAVPDDLAVIGVDDVPAAALAVPALTTIHQPSVAQAHHLAASVVAAIDGGTPPPLPDDPAYLVVRDSA